jgi:hypothetical protein
MRSFSLSLPTFVPCASFHVFVLGSSCVYVVSFKKSQKSNDGVLLLFIVQLLQHETGAKKSHRLPRGIIEQRDVKKEGDDGDEWEVDSPRRMRDASITSGDMSDLRFEFFLSVPNLRTGSLRMTLLSSGSNFVARNLLVSVSPSVPRSISTSEGKNARPSGNTNRLGNKLYKTDQRDSL